LNFLDDVMKINRRKFFQRTGSGALLSTILANTPDTAPAAAPPAAPALEPADNPGCQRLSLNQLKAWQSLHYGMFIHFGMSTFLGKEIPDGSDPAAIFAPDKLDVDQWIAVARDAGMKYAVLTTKHVAGHCLWPSRCTDYTVQNSSNKTDVVEKFVKSCEKHQIKPGFYYCSWDNHHRFGSRTPSDGKWQGMNSFPRDRTQPLPAFTSSLYQTFQTAQITELLSDYGPISEMWIDIPGVLGRGYRTFLYHHIAQLQPETVIMMNSGIGDGSSYNIDYAWPSDLIAIERARPPHTGHRKWRTIEGREYYLPAEHCDPIGKDWFFVPGDVPRPDADLQKQYELTRQAGVNFLLDVPPDAHGRIPPDYVAALIRLRQNLNL